MARRGAERRYTPGVQLFLSFAGEDRDLARSLAAGLSDEGHSVFVDHLSLPHAQPHHRAIRDALRKADLVVFLLSPESVAAGSYARSELAMVNARWPSPGERVLVVETRATEREAIPPYLRGLHRLRPEGDLVAEILAAIDAVRRRRRRRRFLTVAPLLGAAAVTTAWWLRPKLDVRNIAIEGTSAASKGLAVDHDRLRIRWTSSGPPEDLRLSLLAPASGRRTEDFAVSSADSQLLIDPADYRVLLQDRSLGGSNRVRVLLDGDSCRFESRPIEVHVGLTVFVGAYESTIKVAPLIDNSLVPDYAFDARVVIPHRRDPTRTLSLGPRFRSSSQDHHRDNLEEHDWSDVRLAYFGPHDPRAVRLSVVTDY